MGALWGPEGQEVGPSVSEGQLGAGAAGQGVQEAGFIHAHQLTQVFAQVQLCRIQLGGEYRGGSERKGGRQGVLEGKVWREFLSLNTRFVI